MTITKNYTCLAFDFGTKSIGVAVGNSITQSANQLNPLKAQDGVPKWEQIKNLLNEWQITQVIVGHPLNMDGTESEMSIRAKKFSQRVHGRFGVHVELVDERLSSSEAKEIASKQGHKGNYKEQPIDSIAACVILQDWWNTEASQT